MKLSLRLILFSSLTILLVICIAYVSILDSRVINKLEGVLWTVPAKVYARPLELAEGGNINIGQLKKELEILSYDCLLYTSPSPRDQRGSRMPSSA